MTIDKRSLGSVTPRESLTVVTVTRNDTSGLSETFQSLMCQSDLNFTWIVIDGSDRILAERNLKTLDKKSKFSVKYYFRSPQGIYDAMNFAIDQTDSDWITFLNSGDYFYSNKSVNLIHKAIAQSANCDFLAFCVAIATSSGYVIDLVNPTLTNYKEYVYADMNHQGVMMKTKLIRELGKFNTKLMFAADGQLLDRAISETVPVLFCSVSSVFVLGGRSSANFIRVINEIASYRENHPTGLILYYLALKTIVRRRLLNTSKDSLIFPLVQNFLNRKNVKLRKSIELLKLHERVYPKV